MLRSSRHPIRTSLQGFLADESGTTAMEYAIIAAGVSIVIVVSITAIGTSVNGFFTSVSTALK
jgi:pilus assembly protein Flp/PilA